MNRTGRPHEIQPTQTEVTMALGARAQIGEGPVWDARAQRLHWVDLIGRELHVFNPADGTNTTHTCPDIVTSVSPRASGGVLLTLRRSFAFFDETTGSLETIAEVEPEMTGNRFNDGKTDRRGRHWAGTMGDVDWDHPIGNLYRLGADHRPVRMAERVRCSNGIAWSPDDRTMYFCESFAASPPPLAGPRGRNAASVIFWFTVFILVSIVYDRRPPSQRSVAHEQQSRESTSFPAGVGRGWHRPVHDAWSVRATARRDGKDDRRPVLS